MIHLVNKLKKLSSEAIWVSTGSVLMVFISILSTKLFTSLLKPEEYGKFNLILTISTFSSTLVFSPLYQGILRFFSIAKSESSLNTFYSDTFLLAKKSSLAILGIASLICTFTGLLGLHSWIETILLATFFSTLTGYFEIIKAVQTAARHRKIVALLDVCDRLLKLLITSTLIVFLKTGLGAFYGYTAAALIILGIQFLAFFKTLKVGKMLLFVKKKFSDTVEGYSYSKRIISYSKPFAYWGLFQWLHSSSDRWFLERYSGSSTVGYYSALYQIGFQTISIASSIIVSFITPIVYQRAMLSGPSGSHSKSINNYTVWLTIFLGAICVIFTSVYHHLIFKTLVGSDYLHISYFLPSMVLAGSLFAVGQCLSLNLMVEVKSNLLLMPKILTFFVGILLNYLLIKKYGLLGALIAQSATYIVYISSLLYQTKNINRLI